ncbi:penicillin-binding protein 1C [Aminobacter sp. HY435]|uniref:penicillin-binding protein 1C n=1 Tax=Aminobacter sp. HY435 TaxID=2970917 RepID=UPI0022B97434|nr:penicillin-binding protein 1C [Aminobacter sp. HY435]
MLSARTKRRITLSATGTAALAALAVGGLYALDRAFPPPLPEKLIVSAEVLDRDGQLLRAYATPSGHWRLGVGLDQVDPQLVKMLVAYEDKRFWEHEGVDVLALGRAAQQLLANGRIVSGGSTLSMQLARLIEPRASRSLASKLKQLARAIQIERRLSKQEILERYLTLAPYGGNLEGVRAAALAYFGKEPKRLTVSEAALLVALPQLPERRRPDRNPKNAQAARDRVLGRMVTSGVLGDNEAARAALADVEAMRLALPSMAPHVSDAALRNTPQVDRRQLTLRKSVQAGLEAVAREAASRLGPRISVAMVMADAMTGEILGEVGSANYLDASRSGWIDMTRTVRSPGSTLKPFIYGLAFEQGLVAQETMIEDRPADFAGYRPKNFDMSYQGDVSVRQALQLSLNVPAIRLLDAVGPQRLTARFRQAGVIPQLPPNEVPGLAIGLGGVGVTLRDLVQLYTGLANGGRAKALRDGAEASTPAPLANGTILEEQAAWQIADILAGVKPPEGAAKRTIAYKTGTSYGYRDAWSIGYDGRYVLGVWAGRPDAGAVPGLSGYVSAAPILFEGFARSGLPSMPLPRPPAGTLRTARADLPVTLERFSTASELPAVAAAITEPAPQIVFPPDGARVELGASSADASPLVLKLQGGRAPFRWLANGKPLNTVARRREATWQPDGTGFSTLTVIDAAGRAASVQVFVE